MNDMELRIEEALLAARRAEINALLDGHGKIANELMDVRFRLEEIMTSWRKV